MVGPEVIVKPNVVARPRVGPLLVATLASMVSLAQAQEKEPRRIYDVAALIFKETVFLPPLFGIEERRSELAEDPIAGIELADLVTILKDATDPKYWETDGVEVRAEESGLLSITCSEAMHQLVAAVLAGMREWHHEQAVIEMHLLPGTVLRDSNAVLSIEALDTLLRNVSPHPILVERAMVGSTIVMKTSAARSHVVGLEVKAAQNASALDPILDELLTGTAWRVQWQRAPNGLVVHVDGSQCEAAGDPQSRSMVSRADGKPIQMQLPRYRLAGNRATAFLKDGEGLLFGANGEGTVACCLRIRRPRPATGAFTTSPSGTSHPGSLYLRAHSVSHLVRGSLPGGGILYPRAPHDGGAMIPADFEAAPVVVDEGRLQEMLKSTIATDKWDGSPFTMNMQRHVLYVRCDDATHEDVVRLLERLGQDALRRFSLEVRYGPIDGKSLPSDVSASAAKLADGERLRSCLGVASKAGGCNVLAGTMTSIVADYNPVLATEVAGVEPVVGQVFEGVTLSTDLYPVNPTQVRLRFRFGLASLDGPIEPFHLGDDRFGILDLPKRTWQSCNSEPVVDLDQWTLLHLSPIAGSADHFAVLLRVRENE